jgi:polyferredoxin
MMREAKKFVVLVISFVAMMLIGRAIVAHFASAMFDAFFWGVICGVMWTLAFIDIEERE